MSTKAKESAPEAAPSRPKRKVARKSKPASAEKKKRNKKKGPGKYSQLVIDAIKTLGERNGASLFKIYHEAKKTSWFDQQHGRVYLRYSIRALLQNDTLVQVKGLGANGSFKLNKKKFITDTKKSSVKPKKTPKPAKKPAQKAERKKKSVSGVKKPRRTSRAKNIKPKKEDKRTSVEGRKTSKTKKDKQAKKTVQKE